MERKRTTVAILAVLTAALSGGCSDADREKIAEDRARAAQAVEARAKADWTAAKETFDEQKTALWEASAPAREKAEEWSDAASAKAAELKENAAEKAAELKDAATAKAEEWSDAASAKAVEWSERAADAIEDWAARRENKENAPDGEEAEQPATLEAPQENE